MSMKHRVLLIPGALIASMGLAGCAAGYDDYPPDGVVIDHGYYYDPDFYDVYGHYHPRDYWFYDGHGYAHRDFLPHGEVAHLRTFRGRSDFGHGGIGHGGDIGHADLSHEGPAGGGMGEHGGGGGFGGGHGR